MKVFTGHRDADGNAQVVVLEGGTRRPLNSRRDLSNHSPTGFEWGYGGSGPAQLALAILADVLGDDALALRLHQRFKWEVIAPLPRFGEWRFTETDVWRFAANHKTEAAPNE